VESAVGKRQSDEDRRSTDWIVLAAEAALAHALASGMTDERR
jgi:hypothetical protein